MADARAQESDLRGGRCDPGCARGRRRHHGRAGDRVGQVAEQALAVAALILAAVHTGGVYEAPVIGPVDDDSAGGGVGE
ncbi:hypothetical protein [Actinomyces sp. 432]|uniref:hypothetical protein n=1 Tax=Actinomyces sp. 432 TaxID=2057798 RepID=UPI00137A3653|nr:hypothetical protein [Actinomyces sp. 432]